MLISYNWLKTYFDEEIPKPEALAELFNLHTFEVESTSPVENDFILDIKVLPDRAHYDLCHRGIAQEISLITGIRVKNKTNASISESENVKNIGVIVESDLCRRYIARKVENVSVTNSPKWIQDRLISVGARSINNLVDATNFVMFDIGQPLHIFDADKVQGDIKIRLAKSDEKITLLDGREVSLLETDLVIADEVSPLAIAGVKGGKKAEVGLETKNIIIESANFDPVSVRKTSTRLDLRNDSSKRFENEITPELAEEAMGYVSSLIKELNPESVSGKKIDVYKYVPLERKIICSSKYISEMIGIGIDRKEIISILERTGSKVEVMDDEIVVWPPHDRFDLVIPEDITDEIGRIYGYTKLPSVIPPKLLSDEKIDNTFFYSEKVKNILIEKDFSEVVLYSLVPKGFFEILYPLANDKSALRENLSKKMEEALELNTRNAPLLDLETIKIFEIGKIFSKEGERTSLCLGVNQVKKKKGIKSENILDGEIKHLQEKIGLNFDYKIVNGEYGVICEVDFDQIISKLKEEMDLESLGFIPLSPDIRYKSFSIYPFAVRDVAFFSKEKIDERKIYYEIKDKAGEYLAHLSIFDVFSKDFDGVTKISYAYRLVFQAKDKTLVDEEINASMMAVYDHLKSLGFEVR